MLPTRRRADIQLVDKCKSGVFELDSIHFASTKCKKLCFVLERLAEAKTKNYLWEYMEAGIKFYRHFKGGIYKYFGIAKFTEDPSQEMVVYQALYGEKGLWVRPKEMFFSEVERDGYKGPRFAEITEEEAIRLLEENY